MHYPIYTFSENVQRSAADLDLASLGSQACEERERERERGGGVKRLCPLCLANSSFDNNVAFVSISRKVPLFVTPFLFCYCSR